MLSNPRRVAVAVVISCAIAGSIVVTPASAQEGHHSVQLFAINDFHGRISNNIAMSLAHTLQQQRAAYPDSIFISSGDDIGASLYNSMVSEDADTIRFLNTLGLQSSTVGNHEFDRGTTDLTGRVADLAEFPHISANVVDAQGELVFDPYTLITQPDGTRVAIIGATTPDTASFVTPDLLEDTAFKDMVDSVNVYAEQLSDGDESNGEADIIVASYHAGANATQPETDLIVTGTHPAVDAIFTGHTHLEYVFEAPIPDSKQTRPVIQSGSYGSHLGSVSLTVDADGTLVDFSAENINARGNVPAPDLAQADPILTQAQEIVDRAQALADELGSVPLAQLTAPITVGWSEELGFTRRDQESTLGHLNGDAWLWAANNTAGRTSADVGVINSDGMREHLPGGLMENLDTPVENVTTADAINMHAFNGEIWVTTMTGAQLREVLEQQWQTDADGNIAGTPFQRLGFSTNLRYTYTAPTTVEGHQTLGNNIGEIYIDDELVTETQEVRVALPKFLLAGGDNFRAFTEGTDSVSTDWIDNQAFAAYMQDLGTVTPDYGKKAVRMTEIDPVPADGTLRAEVTDLKLHSFKVPESTELTVSLGNTELGTVPVIGGETASIEFDMERYEIVPGTYPLQLVDETTGTVVTQHVEVVAATSNTYVPALVQPADNSGSSLSSDTNPWAVWIAALLSVLGLAGFAFAQDFL